MRGEESRTSLLCMNRIKNLVVKTRNDDIDIYYNVLLYSVQRGKKKKNEKSEKKRDKRRDI